jgi:hypothetical protein
MMNAVSSVKFGAVQALKPLEPKTGNFVITKPDTVAISRLLTNPDQTQEKLRFRFQDGQLQIQKETDDPDSIVLKTEFEPASLNDSLEVFRLARQAEDAPDARGNITNVVKPLLRETFRAQYGFIQTAQQQLDAVKRQAQLQIEQAQGSLKQANESFKLFEPYRTWLTQA